MLPRPPYTLFMLLALGVFVLARRVTPRPPGLLALPGWKRLSLALAALIGGAVGARLPFLFGAGGDGPITAWFRDGKTITTGLMGAYLAVELAKWALGVRVPTGDTFALPPPLALAGGRWGCLLPGCCSGRPTDLPWGVDFGDGLRRHPTQAYESLFHLSAAAGLLVLMRLGLLRHHRLKAYLLAYGAFRFATEYLRPEPEAWLGLTFY